MAKDVSAEVRGRLVETFRQKLYMSTIMDDWPAEVQAAYLKARNHGITQVNAREIAKKVYADLLADIAMVEVNKYRLAAVALASEIQVIAQMADQGDFEPLIAFLKDRKRIPQ